MEAGPINSWFQTCVAIYSSCLDGTVDRTGGFGFEDPLGREISANFRLAMHLLKAFVDAGIAHVGDSGALMLAGGGLFAPTARLDESGRLVAMPGAFDGGDWIPLAPVFGFVSTVSGLVATGCLVAAPFTEGATLACAGPAAAISQGAGAIEAGLGWIEGDPDAKCNTATLAVGVLLPGNLEDFGAEAFAVEVLHSAAGNAMDFACG